MPTPRIPRSCPIYRNAWLAKRLCFAENLVVHPVPLTSTFTVNGEPFAMPSD